MSDDPFKRLSNIAKSKYSSSSGDKGNMNIGAGVIAGSILLGPLGAVLGGVAASSLNNNPNSNGNSGLNSEQSQLVQLLYKQLQDAEKSLEVVEAQLLQQQKLQTRLEKIKLEFYSKAEECIKVSIRW